MHFVGLVSSVTFRETSVEQNFYLIYEQSQRLDNWNTPLE